MPHGREQVVGLTVICISALLTGCAGTNKYAAIDAFASTFGKVVSISTADTTPPDVTLTIPDMGLGMGTVILHPGDSPVTTHIGKMDVNTFPMIATAEDPEGVAAVCFNFDEDRSCTCGGIGEKSFFTYAPECYEMTNTPGSSALTRLWLPHIVDISQHAACAH